MKKYITVEEFVKEHRNYEITIMSPGGYVDIRPDMKLTELSAHAGVSGTDRSITWEELKEQVIEERQTGFQEKSNTWFAISDRPPEMDNVCSSLECQENEMVEESEESHGQSYTMQL